MKPVEQQLKFNNKMTHLLLLNIFFDKLCAACMREIDQTRVQMPVLTRLIEISGAKVKKIMFNCYMQTDIGTIHVISSVGISLSGST